MKTHLRTTPILTALILAATASGCIRAPKPAGFAASGRGQGRSMQLGPVDWRATGTGSGVATPTQPSLPFGTTLAFAGPTAAPASPCAPVQIGPGKWITPLCRPLPPVQVRPFVRKSRLDGQALPANVDLRVRGLDGPVKNQEQVGVCWSFALSSVMDNAARKIGQQASLAPLHLIAGDAWDQMWGAGASSQPFTTEDLWPYVPRKACAFREEDGKRMDDCGRIYGVAPGSAKSDPSLMAELRLADENHRYRFTDIEQLEVKPPNVEQIATVLAEGDAIWAAFRFSYTGWDWNAVKDGVLDDYCPSSTSSGHAVTLVGYRTVFSSGRPEKQFLVKNSWGSDWAEGGYAWMPESMLVRQLTRAFRLRVQPTAAGGGDAGGTGSQPVPQRGGSCAAGQVRDLMTGACSAPCGGVLPPLNGMCPLPGMAPAGAGAGTASNGCAAGSTRDALTGACVAACPSGLPPAFGICVI